MSVSITACTYLVQALPVLSVLKREAKASTASHLLPALAALSVLESSGPMRSTDLAERLQVDKSAVSRQVTGLVGSGLVERLLDPDDHRAHELALTDAGRRRLAEVRRTIAEHLVARLTDWAEADLVSLVSLLERLAATVAAGPGPDPSTHRPDRTDPPATGRPERHIPRRPDHLVAAGSAGPTSREYTS